MSEGPDVSESRFTKHRRECPRPDYWTSDDVQATEREVIEGIAGLIRLLQPDYVIETGTWKGYLALAIARALRKNGHGRLTTIEIEEDLYREAKMRCQSVEPWVHLIHGNSLDFTPKKEIDFAWFDSGPEIRGKEFRRFYEQMHERTVVGFHDTGEHHKIIRDDVLALTEAQLLVPIFLSTPRGVALCQVIK